MTNLKCLHCGLVNFPTAVACKRCGGDLTAAASYATGQQSSYAHAGTYETATPAAELTPPRTLGILLTILGTVISAAGVYLLSMGASPYFLVVGIGIAVSGLLVASGKRAGMYLYFATFGVILLWSIVETAGAPGKLMPRVLLPAIIGLYLASEKVRARLS